MPEEMNTNAAQAPVMTPADPASPAPAPQIDYDKIGEMLDGKLAKTEESFLKGYLKQQGLTGDELNEAINNFKQEKASRVPDVNDLNQQIMDYEDALIEAQSEALYAQVQLEAMMAASELGIDQATIPYVLKMADLSSVIDEGQVDLDTLKESLSQVLEDIPALRVAPEEKVSGFKVGADRSGQDPNQLNTELAKIFLGNKKG